jgi:predicted  nucleic acid-binding Zn-ribbon protein
MSYADFIGSYNPDVCKLVDWYIRNSAGFNIKETDFMMNAISTSILGYFYSQKDIFFEVEEYTPESNQVKYLEMFISAYSIKNTTFRDKIIIPPTVDDKIYEASTFPYIFWHQVIDSFEGYNINDIKQKYTYSHKKENIELLFTGIIERLTPMIDRFYAVKDENMLAYLNNILNYSFEKACIPSTDFVRQCTYNFTSHHIFYTRITKITSKSKQNTVNLQPDSVIIAGANSYTTRFDETVMNSSIDLIETKIESKTTHCDLYSRLITIVVLYATKVLGNKIAGINSTTTESTLVAVQTFKNITVVDNCTSQKQADEFAVSVFDKEGGEFLDGDSRLNLIKSNSMKTFLVGLSSGSLSVVLESAAMREFCTRQKFSTTLISEGCESYKIKNLNTNDFWDYCCRYTIYLLNANKKTQSLIDISKIEHEHELDLLDSDNQHTIEMNNVRLESFNVIKGLNWVMDEKGYTQKLSEEDITKMLAQIVEFQTTESRIVHALIQNLKTSENSISNVENSLREVKSSLGTLKLSSQSGTDAIQEVLTLKKEIGELKKSSEQKLQTTQLNNSIQAAASNEELVKYRSLLKLAIDELENYKTHISEELSKKDKLISTYSSKNLDLQNEITTKDNDMLNLKTDIINLKTKAGTSETTITDLQSSVSYMTADKRIKDQTASQSIIDYNKIQNDLESANRKYTQDFSKLSLQITKLETEKKTLNEWIANQRLLNDAFEPITKIATDPSTKVRVIRKYVEDLVDIVGSKMIMVDTTNNDTYNKSELKPLVDLLKKKDKRLKKIQTVVAELNRDFKINIGVSGGGGDDDPDDDDFNDHYGDKTDDNDDKRIRKIKKKINAYKTVSEYTNTSIHNIECPIVNFLKDLLRQVTELREQVEDYSKKGASSNQADLKLKQEVTHLNQTITDTQTIIKDLYKQIENKDEAIKRLQSSINEINDKFDAYKSACEESIKNSGLEKTTLENNHKNEISILRSNSTATIDDLKTQIQDLETEKSNLQYENKTLQQTIHLFDVDKNNTISTHNTEKLTLQNKISLLDNSIAVGQNTITTLQNRIDQLEKELKKCKVTYHTQFPSLQLPPRTFNTTHRNGLVDCYIKMLHIINPGREPDKNIDGTFEYKCHQNVDLVDTYSQITLFESICSVLYNITKGENFTVSIAPTMRLKTSKDVISQYIQTLVPGLSQFEFEKYIKDLVKPYIQMRDLFEPSETAKSDISKTGFGWVKFVTLCGLLMNFINPASNSNEIFDLCENDVKINSSAASGLIRIPELIYHTMFKILDKSWIFSAPEHYKFKLNKATFPHEEDELVAFDTDVYTMLVTLALISSP